jgi:chromosomal replication initiator protein
MGDTWQKIVTEASKSLSKAHVLTYFQKTALIGYEEGTLVVGLPREFFRTWHEQQSAEPLLLAARDIWPECKKVVFRVDGTLEESSVFDPRMVFGDNKSSSSMNRSLKKSPRPFEKYKVPSTQIGFARRFLNPKLTFEHFIVGDGAALAHAAAEATAREPGGKYNPLFLFGGVGLGKTHLLHAIGNRIADNNPDASILLLPTQNFIDEVVAAVRTGKGDRIRDKYRRTDIFMLDDIQFLKGKERTQEILFHIFNDLHHAGKQIIFSSDCAPSQLDGLEERLVSRFSMGMVADIQVPDFETRLAILEEKAQEDDIEISKDILEYIADQVPESVRELLGVFNQIKANHDLQGIVPNKTNITQILRRRNKDLRDQLDDEEQEETGVVRTIEDVANRTAAFFDIPVERLISSSRLREYVVPRQLAMYFAHKKLRQPLQKIGNFFGGRDHTSVLAGVRKVEKNRKLSQEYWRQCNALRKKMGL